MGHILITGANGFIGKNLLRYLAADASIDKKKIILLSSSGTSGYQHIDHKSYQFSKNDFFEKNVGEIEVIIHAGAFTPKSTDEANLYTPNYENIANTNHLLNNLPNIPSKFIFLSSLDVYEHTIHVIDEQTPVAPADFYGKCKLFCEDMILQWCRQHQVIPQVLRLGHIYGPGEGAYKKMIPSAIRSLKQDISPKIYSYGLEKRSYLNARDCVRAIWNAVSLEKYIGPVNIASSKAYAIKEIVDMLIAVSGKAIKAEVLGNNIQVHDIIFNNQKMKDHLTDERVTIEEGLKEEYHLFESSLN